MHDRVYDGLQLGLDGLLSLLPRKVPCFDHEPLVVAHRGNSGENNSPAENTIAAFQRCADLGVWGIEFDVQWTKDDIPVVIHDNNTARTFKGPVFNIATTDFQSLIKHHPSLPRLSEVIHRFGSTLHLMIELKSEILTDKQQQILVSELNPLEAVKDYHLLSLDPVLLSTLQQFPIQAMMPVALTNTTWMIKQVLQYSFTNISAHYMLLTRKKRQLLSDSGIKIGSGFIPNKPLLLRELGLHSNWMFSNHAAVIQTHLKQLRIN